MRKILILIFLINLYSFYKDKDADTKTIISGKVLNFKKHQEDKTLAFTFTSLFELKEDYVATIENDGSFHIEIPIFYTQDFLLDYGNNYSTHLIRPGDSLYMEIDADILTDPTNKYPNQKYFSRVTGGDLIEENRQISKFLELLPTIYSYDTIKNKYPEAYRTYIAEKEKQNWNIATKFKKDKNTSLLFDLWLNDYLKYQSLDELMRYRWLRPRALQIPRDSFQLPKSYFTFLDEYDMNDKKIITSNHAYFLSEMSNYLSKEENTIAYMESNSTGFTKDVAITNFYISVLDAKLLDAFEKIYDSTRVSNADFRKIIKKKYKDLKLFMGNQDVAKSNLVDIGNHITDDLVKDIVNKFKGKVIYIDFWAPWCAPCLKEMPNSKILQEYFKNRDVVFLFLANRCSEASWKATISNKNLTGKHMLLTNDQFNILASEFNINGIPHYTLIGKDGNVKSKKAKAPNQKDELIKIIEGLLE